jgi:N-acetyl-gamma-glutamyl-phosphate reductase
LTSARLQTAVLGATGYAGFELARLLQHHPRLEKPLLMGRAQDDGAGEFRLEDVFPHAAGNGQSRVVPFDWTTLADSGAEILFLATPHETSRELVPEAIARGLKVVDLSGAWRLKSAAHRAVYGFRDNGDHAALDARAVYGLPELSAEEIGAAQLVANPGCYATSIILALAPLVRAGVLAANSDVVCDSKSGVSGAGKAPSAKTHFVEVADNLSAYAVFAHRHTGEILEQLGLGGERFTFTPHLLPIPRGILSTIYVRLAARAAAAFVEELYRTFYADQPWVRIFGTKLPQIQYSLRTNFCDIGFALAPDGERLVIVSCLDNLMKGAAGQAVQNLNLMCGWDQREGLA